jgi:RND family efflux transporter MFP subunit
MMARRLWSLLLLVPAALLGCNRTNQKADEAPPKPEVKVSEPVREYIVNYEVFTGRTQSVNRVDLKTRVTGYLEKVYVGRDADIEDGKKAWFKLTERSLADLNAQKVPSEVTTKLTPLMHREFYTKDVFQEQLAKVLASQERDKYQDAILKSADSWVIKEGDDVKKGDVLFVLQQKPFEDAVAQARGNLDQLQLQLKFNRRDYDRYRDSKSGASPADLDKALTAVTTTEASVKTAEAALARAQQDLEWATIRAPFDGRIGKRQIDHGNDVKADDTILASIEQINPLYAYFDVDERTLLKIGGLLPNGKVPADAAAKFPLTAGLANEKPEDFSHHGALQFADNKVDPSTGTLRMYGLFENPTGDLKSGMFVRVRMGVGAAQPSYFVAEGALSSDQGRRFLYLLDDENKVLYVEVTVGQRKDGLIAVEGKDRKLKGNEKIIVDGLQRVKPKMEVNSTMVEMPRAGVPQATVAKGQESGEKKKADSGK